MLIDSYLTVHVSRSNLMNNVLIIILSRSKNEGVKNNHKWKILERLHNCSVMCAIDMFWYVSVGG